MGIRAGAGSGAGQAVGRMSEVTLPSELGGPGICSMSRG